VAARRRPTARTAALPARRGIPDVRQLLPSGRSIAVGLLLVVLSVGGYLAARETSLFAVQTVDVRGGSPALRAQVKAALAGELGTSLLGVDGPALARRLDAIPGVRSFTYDRAFPHTLDVVVKREIPVLVVRRVPGRDAFLVAASGKVLATLPNARLAHLPRLWVKNSVVLQVGEDVPAALAGAPAALAAVRGAGLPGGVSSVVAGRDELTLVLRRGLQVRLGDAGDLRLKLAIARRILTMTGAAAAGGYLDVSLPERPVLDTNSRVGG
jgi:cell division septal protein FtsQ